jgi:biotin carboxylase
MSRILLLVTTASYRAGAFLDAARGLNVAVTVGSERAQALAGLHPAGHLVLDFRDLAGATRAIESFAHEHPLAAIVAADDDGVVLAAAAAERLGLRHASREAVEAARDKHRFRRRLVETGVPSPPFARVASLDEAREATRRIGFPCVLKPTALGASRGVMRVNGERQLADAFARLAALLARDPGGSHDVLIERYLPGIEVALEGLVTEGRLRVLALFDKPDPLEGPFFEETIYVTPSRLSEEVQQAIAARAREVVQALGLAHGPVHAELRVDGAHVWPIEIAPRSIGGLCSRALRFGGGESLEALLLRHALGEDVSGLEREAPASGVMMIPIPRAGVLRGVRGLEAALEVPAIGEIRITMHAGDRLIPWPEGNRYLGFIFARDASPARVEAALRESHRLLTFDIEDPQQTPPEAS